jgi:hypothetical protein
MGTFRNLVTAIINKVFLGKMSSWLDSENT